MKRKFVILDRDGTIIIEKNHLIDINEVELIPNAAKAIKKMKDFGLGVIIVTNQTVVGNGHISIKELGEIHKKIINLLSKDKAAVDGLYVCPHTIEDNCFCRKPKLGLIKQALKEHDFNPKESFVIGDKALDIELGQNMHARTFLVRTGYGARVEKENIVKPDFVVDDLEQAVSMIKSIIE